MGISGLVKPADRETNPSEPPQEGSQAATQSTAAPAKSAPTVGWAGFGRSVNAEQRKKVDNGEAAFDQNEDEDDDRGIRFTIGGDGKRMNKDDFLREIQKLERSNREVPGNLAGSNDAIGAAKVQPLTAQGQASSAGVANPYISVTQASESARGESTSPSRPADITRGRSGARGTEDVPSTDTPETAAERRRRLAALAGVRDDDSNETPAERRRREAALGVTDHSPEESDSDDDDTPRIPPERRGIRFADGPAKKA